MSVAIVEIVSGDKGFDLQNGHWIRPWSFGSTWTTIRIGARFHFPVSSAALLTGGPQVWFGLCSGTAAAPGVVANASIDHAVFYRSNQVSWTYNTGGLLTVGANNTSQIVKYVAGTPTTANLTSISILGAISSTPSTIRQCVVVTITKGSPNYTVAVSRRTSTSNVADNAYSNILLAMESSDPATAMAGAGNGTTSTTIAVDEATDGTLDHVFLRWDRTTVPCYVSEVLVARVA